MQTVQIRKPSAWQKLIAKFAKFLGVGAIATLMQYALLIVFVEQFGWNAVAASAAAYALSAAFNYVLNYYFTFASSASHGRALARFVAVAAIGLGLNSALMYLLTDVLDVHYVIAQLVATGIVLMWNFVAHKLWTYK